MHIIKNYLRGARFSIRSWQLVTLLYLVHTLLGLVMVLPFYSAMKDTIGPSMALENFHESFQYTAWTEFTRNFSQKMQVFVGIIGYALLFSLFVQVFLKGGILAMIREDYARFTLKRFAEACGTWFMRFLQVSLIVLLLHLVLAFLIWLPASLILQHQFTHTFTGQSLFRTVLITLILHFMLGSLLFLFGEYTRYTLFLSDKTGVFRAFRKAVVLVLNKIYLVYPLFLLLLVNGILLSLVWFFLQKATGFGTGLTLLLLFLLQQAVFWLRNMLRLWLTASQFYLYSEFPNPLIS
ncbi:MAG TPA: hypothetical protein ENF21_00305 [Bacteroidetes bacterium]|nr:hypothetical protein [Bacteroidota bacterium]